MKWVICMITAVVLVGGAAANAGTDYKSDPVALDLVSGWTRDRDELTNEIIVEWLQQVSPETVARHLTRLANICMNIAITTRKADPLFAGLKEYECQSAGLLDLYLACEGASVALGGAFAGRHFELFQEKKYQ